MDYMKQALNLAKLAQNQSQVPVGAVVVDEHGYVVGRGHNTDRIKQDPSAHAEIVAIREACSVNGKSRLDGCSLYTTLEPCIMCFGVILMARLSRVYYGATDEKNGVFSCFEHIMTDLKRTSYSLPEIYGGIEQQACGKLLSDFFAKIRSCQQETCGGGDGETYDCGCA